MSPVEIFINGHPFKKSGRGPSEVQLPNPPEGAVAWHGDGSGWGAIVAGPNKTLREFQLEEIGDEATFEVPERTSGLFPMAGNTTTLVVIKRINPPSA